MQEGRPGPSFLFCRCRLLLVAGHGLRRAGLLRIRLFRGGFATAATRLGLLGELALPFFLLLPLLRQIPLALLELVVWLGQVWLLMAAGAARKHSRHGRRAGTAVPALQVS